MGGQQSLEESSPGYVRMKVPAENKGLAFSNEEREKLRLHGLLPPAVIPLDLQVQRTMEQFRAKATRIEKYIFLQSIQDVNETLYYACLCRHTYEVMPFVYTPVVGQACIEFSHIYRQTPRGLYLPYTMKGRLREILDNWPYKDVRAIVFTDGERILGLGDQGVDGMGIPIGKLALYVACAGVAPQHCLPITLDVGTNNQEKRQDPFYMGLKMDRVRGDEYDEFLDEFIEAAKDAFGSNVMLQFEDFGNQNAFRLLDRWRHNALCFNDDIQGTAAVVLAGLMAAVRITGRPLYDSTVLFFGAGEAGVGIADLIAYSVHKEAEIPFDEARQRIFLVDSKGLVVKSRLKSLQHHKRAYAHDIPKCDTLLAAVEAIRPTTLIGVSTIPQSFTQEVVERMSYINQKPIIFALSNPTSKAECTAEQVYQWSNGSAVYASGSPFDPVTLPDGRTFVPGQGNNAYVFPGIGLGVTVAKATRLRVEDMYAAALALAQTVPEKRLKAGCVYPHLNSIRQVSVEVAAAVASHCIKRGDTLLEEKPSDIKELCRQSQYMPEY
uniref:Malic enzyme n=1 Tax=Fibrocapsa japonica TaxID=94617 RepID=A0A7S2UW90_9STRA|mmetsp:Transcript_16587/g.24387  ORF Transcript_16587/g.24387 Transcript_16587/m.24387 type:complete len:551 (+) Transcript_16587:67-1719(+)